MLVPRRVPKTSFLDSNLFATAGDLGGSTTFAPHTGATRARSTNGPAEELAVGSSSGCSFDDDPGSNVKYPMYPPANYLCIMRDVGSQNQTHFAQKSSCPLKKGLKVTNHHCAFDFW